MKNRPVTEYFGLLIEKTTRGSHFPVINLNDPSLVKLLDLTTCHLEKILKRLVSKNHSFRKSSIRYLSSLSKDGILSKISTVYTEALKSEFPLILKEEKEIINLILYTKKPERIEKYSLILVYLSALDFIRWPFDETETVNFMLATPFVVDFDSQLELFELFELYENVGIDLSHLNSDVLVRNLHRACLLESNVPKLNGLSIFCDPIVIALFFYKNKALKDALFYTLKLEVIASNVHVKMKKKDVIEVIRKADDFVKILEAVNPGGSKNVDEKKRVIKKKIETEIRLLFDTCITDMYPVIQNCELSFKKGFERVINDIEVEINDSKVHLNFDFMESYYINEIQSSYRRILNFIARENFKTDLIREVNLLTELITAWKIVNHMEKKYETFPLVKFLYSFVDEDLILTDYLTDHLYRKITDTTVKSLGRVNSLVKKQLRRAEESEGNLLREIALQVRSYKLSFTADRLTEVMASDITKQLSGKAKAQSIKEFRRIIRDWFKILFEYCTHKEISFRDLILALIKLLEIIQKMDCHSNTNYTAWFVREIENEKRLNDLYKSIITGKIPDNRTVLEKAKALYVLLIILRTLKEKLNYSICPEFLEDSIVLSSTGPNVFNVLVFAVIKTKLIEFCKGISEDVRESFNITGSLSKPELEFKLLLSLK